MGIIIIGSITYCKKDDSNKNKIPEGALIKLNEYLNQSNSKYLSGIPKFILQKDTFYKEDKLVGVFEKEYTASIFYQNKIENLEAYVIPDYGRLLINKKDNLNLLFQSEINDVNPKILNNVFCIYILDNKLIPIAAFKKCCNSSSIILEIYDSFSAFTNNMVGRKYNLSIESFDLISYTLIKDYKNGIHSLSDFKSSPISLERGNYFKLIPLWMEGSNKYEFSN